MKLVCIQIKVRSSVSSKWPLSLEKNKDLSGNSAS